MITLVARRVPLLTRLSSGMPWAILALPAALAAAWLFETRPMLIELSAVLLLALPLLVSPKARVLFLVIGTVTVFGPPELNASKLLFLFGATVALGGALARSRALARTPLYSDLRPLFRASFVLLFVIGLSLPVAQLNGVAKTDWVRDVAPYVLLTWAPLFALDAQSAFGIRALRRLIALAGLAAALVFTIHWYGRRDIATDITGESGLATLLLSGALFSFAIAMALDGEKGRLRWLALGSGVFAMLATSGTRTAAVLLVAPLAIVAGTRRRLARRSIRLAVMLPITVLLVALGSQSLLRLFKANPEAVSQRIEVVLRSGTASDNSYIDRLNEIHSAWDLFTTAPLFGVGPGHMIQWTSAEGKPQATTYIDSPVGFLPDYGVVGVFAVGFLVASFVSVVRRLYRRAGERTTAQLALIGFGFVFLAHSLLQESFEDKGLSAGLMLLLAAAAREAMERSERVNPRESAE